VNLDPDQLRRAIDEALAEIDEIEAEVMDFFADLGGPEAVRRVAEYKRAQENLPRNAPLRDLRR